MVLGHYDARLEERESKKGTKYQVLIIKLSDRVEKLVFLTDAELELLKLQKSTSSNYESLSPTDF